MEKIFGSEQSNTRTCKVIPFLKESGIWYADIPEFLEKGLGTRANLIMVDGADTLLDLLSDGESKVILTVSPKSYIGCQSHMVKIHKGLDRALLDHVGHAPVEYGAYYDVTIYNGAPFHHTLWLCPVTEYVFGEYPLDIYFSTI